MYYQMDEFVSIFINKIMLKVFLQDWRWNLTYDSGCTYYYIGTAQVAQAYRHIVVLI